MAESLSDFTVHVKEWNQSVYGYIGTRKRQLLRSLANIQKAMDQSPSKRRKFNRIMALRNCDGEWCSDQSTLSDEAVRFFEGLYGEVSSPILDLPLNTFPSLREQDIDFLKKLVLNEEIKKALFDMAPLKAPGSDGFHAHFFQSQWDLVRGTVCERVQGIFTGNKIEDELNNTLIMLIPKKDCPEDFSQFQPISLCSVMYKLVIKVIANRFRVVFPKFISPEQAGFIAGRNISDNIIIAQEVIYSMCSKKAGRNWMAVKLDLEKAYDRINWDFIDVSLVAARILELLGRFNLVSCKDALWVRVLQSKYGWKDQIVDSIHKNNSSHLWKSLSKVWPLFRENIMWSVRDGTTIRGWKDSWILDVGPLFSYIPVHDRLNLDSRLKD
ncbi:hypothetical protein J1N35_034231 [Gossypium stocksii]|uniref:Reverse transcriptase domain-containing protein n=1 Tax=Gossypium stocksii TaxID=47602 RepID=A0A9D3ZP18_9ROSI|nr:hypothetical protein J1N35_034231 [Gossypium stocksii]